MPTAAERLVRALYKATEGRPGQWRMISALGAVATEKAIAEAAHREWLTVEGDHSLQLTEAGRRAGKAQTR